MKYRVICLALMLALASTVAATAGVLSQISNEMAAIAKQASPAAVQIDVERTTPGSGELSFGAFKAPQTLTKSVGSGFVIDRSGYILTSADVVANAKTVKIRFNDGSSAEGTAVGSDPIIDCAVIKVAKAGLSALALGDSDALQPGMLVVTVNSQSGMSNSVSLGVVAATDREAGSVTGPVIQISGTIGPGASGGAVLDTEGKVVGVTFAMFSPTSRVTPFNIPKIYVTPPSGSTGAFPFPPNAEAMKSLKDLQEKSGTSLYWSSPEDADAVRAAMDMAGNAVDVARTSGSSGFALPINRIKPILAQLKAGKTIQHAALGMRLEPDPAGIKAYPSTDSPADKAGVKGGDVLVSIDGRKFQSVAAITAYIIGLQPGSKVNLVVQRDGKDLPIPVVAGSRDDVFKSDSEPTQPKAPARPLLPKTLDKSPVKGSFSLSLDDADIKTVAKAISEASGVSVIVANPEYITGKVTVHLNSTNLDTALTLICDALQCKYEMHDNSYVLRPAK